MNRSFRAPESQMLAAMKQRQQLRASVMKEKEEELSLFLEMKKREKERNDLLLNHSEEFDAPLGAKPGTSPIFNLLSSNPAPPRKTVADDFLNSESDKNDYDWLLTPPGTPLFPSLEMESQRTVMSQMGTPKARPTSLKSRLANPQLDIPARSSGLAPKQPASSPGLNSSRIGMNSSSSVTRRPSSSGGPGSRPSTPTGRPTLTPTSRTSRPSTPTSRPSLPSSKSTVPVSKTTVSAATKPSNTSKPTIASRSSTPSRSTARSSTPTSRSTVPPPKSTSRAPTPTRRPSTPSSYSAPSITGPASLTRSTNSVSKPVSSSVTNRNPTPSRGASPTVKSRPWKPSEMPGYSLDAPPNLRTTLPDRPLSASRGRPGAPNPRSSSIEPGPAGRPRRQSCSPSRGRAPNGAAHPSGVSVPAIRRSPYKISDNSSPASMGTKMVERVINMRKLVPPKQDDKLSPRGNLSAKSSSPDSSGFGRSLSKKSLDMAIRHMDISRRSIPGNLRPLMTNIPASSMYSVRSGGPTRSRTISVSDSPLATSSNASSELSVNNNGHCLDGGGSEMEDEMAGERGGRSPARMRCR